MRTQRGGKLRRTPKSDTQKKSCQWKNRRQRARKVAPIYCLPVNMSRRVLLLLTYLGSFVLCTPPVLRVSLVSQPLYGIAGLPFSTASILEAQFFNAATSTWSIDTRVGNETIATVMGGISDGMGGLMMGGAQVYLDGNISTHFESGRAVFTGLLANVSGPLVLIFWTILTRGGIYSNDVTSINSIPPDALFSSPFNVTARIPAILAITRQLGNGYGGITISPSLVVSVRDSVGNVPLNASSLTGDAALIWLNATLDTSIACERNVLSCNASLVSVIGSRIPWQLAVVRNGTAVWDRLAVDIAGTGYRLNIMPLNTTTLFGTITSFFSASFIISVGTPAHLVISQQPPLRSVADVPFIDAPHVTVVDAGGNIVTDTNTSTALTVSLSRDITGHASLTDTIVARGYDAARVRVSIEPGDMLVAISGGEAAMVFIENGNEIIPPLRNGDFVRFGGSERHGGGVIDMIHSSDVIPIWPPLSAMGARIRTVRALNDGKLSLAIQLDKPWTGPALRGVPLWRVETSLLSRLPINGTSIFNNIMITTAGMAYKLLFSYGSLQTESRTFTVIPGSPSALRVLRAPDGAWAGGSPWITQPRIALTDMVGNTISGWSGGVIKASITQGVGSLVGIRSVVIERGIAEWFTLGLAPGKLRAAVPRNITIRFSIHMRGAGYLSTETTFYVAASGEERLTSAGSSVVASDDLLAVGSPYADGDENYATRTSVRALLIVKGALATGEEAERAVQMIRLTAPAPRSIFWLTLPPRTFDNITFSLALNATSTDTSATPLLPDVSPDFLAATLRADASIRGLTILVNVRDATNIAKSANLISNTNFNAGVRILRIETSAQGSPLLTVAPAGASLAIAVGSSRLSGFFVLSLPIYGDANNDATRVNAVTHAIGDETPISLPGSRFTDPISVSASSDELALSLLQIGAGVVDVIATELDVDTGAREYRIIFPRRAGAANPPLLIPNAVNLTVITASDTLGRAFETAWLAARIAGITGSDDVENAIDAAALIAGRYPAQIAVWRDISGRDTLGGTLRLSVGGCLSTTSLDVTLLDATTLRNALIVACSADTENALFPTSISVRALIGEELEDAVRSDEISLPPQQTLYVLRRAWRIDITPAPLLSTSNISWITLILPTVNYGGWFPTDFSMPANSLWGSTIASIILPSALGSISDWAAPAALRADAWGGSSAAGALRSGAIDIFARTARVGGWLRVARLQPIIASPPWAPRGFAAAEARLGVALAIGTPILNALTGSPASRVVIAASAPGAQAHAVPPSWTLSCDSPAAAAAIASTSAISGSIIPTITLTLNASHTIPLPWNASARVIRDSLLAIGPSTIWAVDVSGGYGALCDGGASLIISILLSPTARNSNTMLTIDLIGALPIQLTMVARESTGGGERGSVLIFESNDEGIGAGMRSWTQTATFWAPSVSYAGWGKAIALTRAGGDGGGLIDTLVVSAPDGGDGSVHLFWRESNETVILGDANIDGINGGSWVKAEVLTPLTATQVDNNGVSLLGGACATHFGAAVAFTADGNLLIVGGPGAANCVGAVWLFARDSRHAFRRARALNHLTDHQAAGWASAGMIWSPYPFGTHASFGASIGAGTSTAIIGAPGAACGGLSFKSPTGAAAIFERDLPTTPSTAGFFTLESVFCPDMVTADDVVGSSVAINAMDSIALIGMPRADFYKTNTPPDIANISPSPLVVTTAARSLGGYFTLILGHSVSRKLAWDALASSIRIALETDCGAGIVHVTREGPNTQGTFSWAVTFHSPSRAARTLSSVSYLFTQIPINISSEITNTVTVGHWGSSFDQIQAEANALNSPRARVGSTVSSKLYSSSASIMTDASREGSVPLIITRAPFSPRADSRTAGATFVLLREANGTASRSGARARAALGLDPRLGSWNPTAVLAPAELQPRGSFTDAFGLTVAISPNGGVAVVGSPSRAPDTFHSIGASFAYETDWLFNAAWESVPNNGLVTEEAPPPLPRSSSLPPLPPPTPRLGIAWTPFDSIHEEIFALKTCRLDTIVPLRIPPPIVYASAVSGDDWGWYKRLPNGSPPDDGSVIRRSPPATAIGMIDLPWFTSATISSISIFDDDGDNYNVSTATITLPSMCKSTALDYGDACRWLPNGNFDVSGKRDFVPAFSAITIGSQNAALNVDIIDDDVLETPERFHLRLSLPGVWPLWRSSLWSSPLIVDEGDGAISSTLYAAHIEASDFPVLNTNIIDDPLADDDGGSYAASLRNDTLASISFGASSATDGDIYVIGAPNAHGGIGSVTISRQNLGFLLPIATIEAPQNMTQSLLFPAHFGTAIALASVPSVIATSTNAPSQWIVASAPGVAGAALYSLSTGSTVPQLDVLLWASWSSDIEGTSSSLFSPLTSILNHAGHPTSFTSAARCGASTGTLAATYSGDSNAIMIILGCPAADAVLIFRRFLDSNSIDDILPSITAPLAVTDSIGMSTGVAQLVGILTPPLGSSQGVNFGASVVLSGSRLIIGSPLSDAISTVISTTNDILIGNDDTSLFTTANLAQGPALSLTDDDTFQQQQSIYTDRRVLTADDNTVLSGRYLLEETEEVIEDITNSHPQHRQRQPQNRDLFVASNIETSPYPSINSKSSSITTPSIRISKSPKASVSVTHSPRITRSSSSSNSVSRSSKLSPSSSHSAFVSISKRSSGSESMSPRASRSESASSLLTKSMSVTNSMTSSPSSSQSPDESMLSSSTSSVYPSPSSFNTPSPSTLPPPSPTPLPPTSGAPEGSGAIFFYSIAQNILTNLTFFTFEESFSSPIIAASPGSGFGSTLSLSGTTNVLVGAPQANAQPAADWAFERTRLWERAGVSACSGGWVVTGSAWGLGPAARGMVIPRSRSPLGPEPDVALGKGAEGIYWAFSGPGNEATGTLTSPTFSIPSVIRIPTPLISFLIAGGCDSAVTFVELIVDGKHSVFRATGDCSALSRRVEWDLSAYSGQSAVLRAVDAIDSGPWGWLALDDVRLSWATKHSDVETPRAGEVFLLSRNGSDSASSSTSSKPTTWSCVMRFVRADKRSGDHFGSVLAFDDTIGLVAIGSVRQLGVRGSGGNAPLGPSPFQGADSMGADDRSIDTRAGGVAIYRALPELPSIRSREWPTLPQRIMKRSSDSLTVTGFTLLSSSANNGDALIVDMRDTYVSFDSHDFTLVYAGTVRGGAAAASFSSASMPRRIDVFASGSRAPPRGFIAVPVYRAGAGPGLSPSLIASTQALSIRYATNDGVVSGGGGVIGVLPSGLRIARGVTAAEGALCLSLHVSLRSACGDYIINAGTLSFSPQETRAEILIQLIEKPCILPLLPASLTIYLFTPGAPDELVDQGSINGTVYFGDTTVASGSRSVMMLIHCSVI